MEEKEILYPIPYRNVNLRQIKDLNVKSKNYLLPKDILKNILMISRWGRIFFFLNHRMEAIQKT